MNLKPEGAVIVNIIAGIGKARSMDVTVKGTICDSFKSKYSENDLEPIMVKKKQ